MSTHQAYFQELNWPLLDAMVIQKSLGYVDRAIAEHLLGGKLHSNESVAAFLCHLSMSAQQGHLCVTIEGENIDPDPASVWVAKSHDETTSIDVSLLQPLPSMIVKGSQTIGKELLKEIHLENAAEPLKMTPVYKNGSRYYLQRNWILESYFIKNYLNVIQEDQPRITVDIAKVIDCIDVLKKSGKLLDEQARGIMRGCLSCLTVIIGGPGTGKTYTAGLLLKTLWENLEEPDKSNCKIIVTAPTGKAAAHLEGSILRALDGFDAKPVIKAQTLHALLGVKGHRQVERHMSIDGDIIIVDESSMIDVWIMGDLFASIKPGSRLIMLGDTSQLPAVDAGSLFADIVSHLKENTVSVETITELKVCQRAELKDIVDLATHINEGDVQGVLNKIHWEDGSEGIVGINLERWATTLQAQHAIVHAVAKRYPLITDVAENPIEILRKFSSFRLLSPMREGYLGVHDLNKNIYFECYKKAVKGSYFAVPIMITKNDYRMNVFNGDMGILIQPVGLPHETPFVYLLDRAEDCGFRKVGLSSIPSYEYAYCLSVHKSQGSEFGSIALVVPKGSEIFGREALYTAVTRARKNLEIWTHKDTLKKMIEKDTKRHSGIINRLSTLNNKE